MEERVKELLKLIPYPLVLLMARRGEEINGMPLSWFSQVSKEPRLVMVAVMKSRYSHDMVSETGRFAIVFLKPSQKNLITQFKGVNREGKFKGLKVGNAPSGCPILEDAIGYLDCRLLESHTPGDHTLFIAEITDAKVFSKGPALTMQDFGPDYHYGI